MAFYNNFRLGLPLIWELVFRPKGRQGGQAVDSHNSFGGQIPRKVSRAKNGNLGH